jgi:hypothetical protein
MASRVGAFCSIAPDVPKDAGAHSGRPLGLALGLLSLGVLAVELVFLRAPRRFLLARALGLELAAAALRHARLLGGIGELGPRPALEHAIARAADDLAEVRGLEQWPALGHRIIPVAHLRTSRRRRCT